MESFLTNYERGSDHYGHCMAMVVCCIVTPKDRKGSYLRLFGVGMPSTDRIPGD